MKSSDSESNLVVVKVKRGSKQRKRKVTKPEKKKRSKSPTKVVIEINEKHKKRKPRKKSTKRKKKASKKKKKKRASITFSKCKKLYLDSALKGSNENLELVERELKELMLDYGLNNDKPVNSLDEFLSIVSDENAEGYDNKLHVKLQFLIGMKKTMEIGNIVQKESKKIIVTLML